MTKAEKYTLHLREAGRLGNEHALLDLAERFVKRELEHTECLILIVLDRLLEKIPTDYSGIVIISRADYYAAWFYKIANKILSKQSPNRTLLKFENLLNETPINQIEQFNVKEETAVIIHTSGTTGDPKGVMLTHYNLVVNALQSYHWLRGWGYSSKPQKLGWPIILCAVPFFHSYGLNILNEALSYGCTLALIPDPKPKAILNMIQK